MRPTRLSSLPGALENHPGVLEELCRQRTLLGNKRPVCRRVRDPSGLNEVLRRNHIPCPDIRTGAGPWWLPPLTGSLNPGPVPAGIGVGFYDGRNAGGRLLPAAIPHGRQLFRQSILVAGMTADYWE